MKHLFTLLSLAAIMMLPAAPMIETGNPVSADADTIIAKKGDPNTGPGGWKDAPKPPVWSKSKKTSQLEVIPGDMFLAKKGDPKTGPGGWKDAPKPPGWSQSNK